MGISGIPMKLGEVVVLGASMTSETVTSEAATSEAAALKVTQITHSASNAVKMPLVLCSRLH